MSDFRGDVTVIAGDVEYPAWADLLSWAEQRQAGALDPPEGDVPGLSVWNGSLKVADWEVVEALTHGQELELRLPDGRVGRCVVSRHSSEAGLMVIEGSGAPPF
ncbi:hypothetical protein ABZ070_22025 [Streptomyces sp. NPDC006283]|uniref:hypothetical protein n=1 Tax=Streptomyces sp. NPDC006283 TaxID=3156741 RepID=UPI0033BBD9FF